jgi:hypothetical protein
LLLKIQNLINPQIPQKLNCNSKTKVLPHILKINNSQNKNKNSTSRHAIIIYKILKLYYRRINLQSCRPTNLHLSIFKLYNMHMTKRQSSVIKHGLNLQYATTIKPQYQRL